MIHDRLRIICEAAHITGRDLAREADLHEDSIGRYMAGLRPSEEAAQRMKDALARLLARRAVGIATAKHELQKTT